MGIIKALFLQSLPRRYGISIYILDGILPIYRITTSFSQDLPRICVFPYIGETMLFLLIYRKQTLFIFSFSPRIYVYFLYMYSKNTIFPRLYFSIQGKQYFSYIDAFSLFCPEFRDVYIYIYIQHRHSFSFQFLPRGISLYRQQ